MQFVDIKYSVGAAMISVAMMAGCGGGGDSSGSTTTAATSTISSANASDVAANAVNASNGISQSGSVSSLITGVTVDASNAVSAGLINTSLQQIYKALENQAAANLVAGVTATQSYPCTNGGSVSATVNEAVTGTLSSGDSVSVTATQCVEGSTTLNGGFSASFSNLSGTPGSASAWSGAIGLKFNNFNITEGAETARINGDMALSISQLGYLNATASISGSSLQLSLSRSGAVVIDRTLSAYSYSGAIKSNLETYSINFTMTGDFKTASNGAYGVTTTTSFKQIYGAYPYQGALKVVGSGNTSVTLTALDNTNVRLDIDKNGDGATDETVNTTWLALESRI